MADHMTAEQLRAELEQTKATLEELDPKYAIDAEHLLRALNSIDSMIARLSGMGAVPALSAQSLRDLQRFAECCNDMDAGGHDVPKDRMKRLEKVGAVRSCGFGRHETTAFGDAVLAATIGPAIDPWRHISTAPKSTVSGDRNITGLYLLGFVPDPDAVDRESCIRVIWWEPLMKNSRGGRGIWVTDASDAEVFPTHWRPLPAAPEPPHV